MVLILQKARLIQTLSDELLLRAQEIETLGIKGPDALHLACAEKLKARYFVTCDDKIIRRYKGTMVAINPVGFTMGIVQQEADNADS